MLLFLITSALALVLTYNFVVNPVAEAARKRDAARFDETYRYVKLCAIRRHYPALHGMSLDEIEQRYNVDEAFDRIRC